MKIFLRYLLLLAAGFHALAVQAQPEPIRYGQVAASELTAAPFAADSGAAAVVLCDFGRARLDGHLDNLKVVFERLTRIKILTKAGYEQATFEIPLYHREGLRERVSNLRGTTYNLVNGAVQPTALETGGMFIEQRTPTLDVQKATLPNVREGAVIEFAYTLTSDFLFGFHDWTFQHNIPVRWSEYRASIPLVRKYTITYHGYQDLAVNALSVGRTSLKSSDPLVGAATNNLVSIVSTEDHRWVLQDVPAFRAEPYMTVAADYLAALDFQLVGRQLPDLSYQKVADDWPRINRLLLSYDDFGRQLERGHFLKSQMQPLAARYPDPAARAAAVRAAVQAGIRYDGHNRFSTETPLRKAYDAHLGTSADVNLLLIAALREAGLPASPVLLSTRDHGRVSRDFPLLEQFNYVVALVPLADGKDLLVDATDPLLPCGMLPARCLNQTGRLIPPEHGGPGRWVDLLPTQHQVRYQQATLVLDAQGSLQGKVHEEHGGYAAAATRQELSSQGEKKYLAGLQRRHDAWTVPALTVGHAQDPTQPLTVDYEFRQAAPGAGPASPLYLSPLSAFGDPQNPFARESRTYPVDFAMPQDEVISVTLALPTGYELAAVPRNATVELPDGSARFVYSAAISGTTVQLVSRLTLRKPIYGANQYPNLRELYRLMLEKQGEQLIIQKKAG